MTKANDLASLLDANGDVVSSALDNVPAAPTPSLSSLGIPNHDDVTVDASGNVGIGGSPTSKLSVNDANGIPIHMGDISAAPTSQTAAYVGVSTSSFTGGNGDLVLAPRTSDARSVVFYTGNGTSAERMRIDSSGNLLVGKAISSTALQGIEVDGPNGLLVVTRNGYPTATFNRLTSDGSIVDFRKDSTTVGSIGSYVSLPYIGKSDVNLLFDPAGPHIIPRGTNGGARDAAINLGSTTNRFNDLYLSGGVYLGGTGSANHLDDYEEGTWNVTIVNGGLTPTVTSASYTKIGNRVFLSCQLLVPTNTEGQYMALGGLPFSTNGDSAGSLAYTTATTSDSIGLLVQGSIIYFYKDGQAYATSEFSNHQLRISAQYRTS